MGKRAIVTGASSGIGRETAKQLAADGWKVLAVARRGDRLEDLRKACPDAIVPLVADICEEDVPARMVNTAVTEFGGLDLLVNNAGTIWFGQMADMPVAEVDRLLDLNIRAPMLCTRAAIPALEKSPNALIVNISSVTAQMPMAMVAVYCATKAAVTQFSRCLARELNERKIRVCALSPTGTNTEIFASNPAVDPSAFIPASDMAAMVLTLTRLPESIDVQELVVEKRFKVVVGGCP